MQFDKEKPSTPNKIPVQLTVPEVEWLYSEAPLGMSEADAEQKAVHLGLMRKVMQARRNAVGDQLPESVASLPLIHQDMPPGKHFLDGVVEWGMAMGDLHAIDLFPLNPDEPALHTVAVELTLPELAAIVSMADFVINTTSEPREAGPELTEAEQRAFGIEPGSPTPVQHQEIARESAVERDDIARGMLDAIADYWGDTR